MLGSLEPLMGHAKGNLNDPFSKINLHSSPDKTHFSQSSGFQTFDTFNLRQGKPVEPLRLDQMITLAIFKSDSGTIKKMLHGPTLRLFCIKEVPLANREIRQLLKEWVSSWEQLCTSENFIRVYQTFWNSPEGCVSVVMDFAANGSLYNLLASGGALPESTMQQLAKSVLKSLDFLHENSLVHS